MNKIPTYKKDVKPVSSILKDYKGGPYLLLTPFNNIAGGNELPMEQWASFLNEHKDYYLEIHQENLDGVVSASARNKSITYFMYFLFIIGIMFFIIYTPKDEELLAFNIIVPLALCFPLYGSIMGFLIMRQEKYVKQELTKRILTFQKSLDDNDYGTSLSLMVELPLHKEDGIVDHPKK